MNNIKKWAADHSDIIQKWIDNKEYRNLLKEYYELSGLSISRISKHFNCSRRAMKRYLAGTRQVPMAIVKIMLETMNFEYENANPIKQKEQDSEVNNDGAFIWHGNNDQLFNTLWLYRSKILHINRFDAACQLNIPESTLKEYEDGNKKISLPDIQKILTTYQLKLDELFPALVSYDGGKTYLPLKYLWDITIGDEVYDLSECKLYVDENNDHVYKLPKWPIPRYDSSGRIMLNYMPNELTIDEYINTDELLFMNDDGNILEGKDFSNLKLPPSYQHILSIRKGSKKYERYCNIMDSDEYRLYTDGHIFTATFRFKNRNRWSAIFNLSDYVFSDSPWYSLLQDPDYFYKGRVQFIGKEIPQNQCIIWPDGQYIRIIELYMDRSPYRFASYTKGLTCNRRYDQWVDYLSPDDNI